MSTILLATDASASAATSAAQGGVSSFIPMILPILLILAVYFIPTIIAIRRQHTNKTAIILLNVFLGWTFIGWVITLVWSVLKKDK